MICIQFNPKLKFSSKSGRIGQVTLYGRTLRQFRRFGSPISRMEPLIIAVSILIQGERRTVLVGVFLVANHNLSWSDFLIPSISSLIVGDIFIFLFGRLIRNTRFSWKFYRKIKHRRRTQFYFHYVRENIVKLMIISKFLVVANIFAVLVISWSKVSFAKFMKSQFISIFLCPFFTAVTLLLRYRLHLFALGKNLHDK